MREYEKSVISTYMENYIRVIEARLDTFEFEIIKDSTHDESISDYKNFKDVVESFSSSDLIQKEDYYTVKYFLDFNYINKRLLSGEKVLNIRYRRKYLGVYVPISLTVVPAEDYCKEHQHVILFEKKLDDVAASMNALSNIYVSVHLIKLDNYTYECIKGDKYVEMFENQIQGNVQEKINFIMDKMATKEYKKKVLEFFDFSTVEKRIKNQKYLSLIFVGNFRGWCRARIIPVNYDSEGNLKKLLMTIEDIDQEKRKEDKLRYFAETDVMTGALNRNHGQRAIKKLMKSGAIGLFCMLDIDKFKSINDTYGHDVGDAVLIELADKLSKTFRGGDIVMRLGGG